MWQTHFEQRAFGLPEQNSFEHSGGQEQRTSGGQGDCTQITGTSSQIWSERQPPLSSLQSDLQKGSPVFLSTLHRLPLPHFTVAHGLRHWTTGGHGARLHCTSCRVQISFLAHPPLSRLQSGVQKVSPVGSNTSQRWPGRHFSQEHWSRHSTTGGQGAQMHNTGRIVHISSLAQPPLSRLQSGVQKASPVGLNTSQRWPSSHFKVAHGSCTPETWMNNNI